MGTHTRERNQQKPEFAISLLQSTTPAQPLPRRNLLQRTSSLLGSGPCGTACPLTQEVLRFWHSYNQAHSSYPARDGSCGEEPQLVSNCQLKCMKYEASDLRVKHTQLVQSRSRRQRSSIQTLLRTLVKRSKEVHTCQILVVQSEASSNSTSASQASVNTKRDSIEPQRLTRCLCGPASRIRADYYTDSAIFVFPSAYRTNTAPGKDLNGLRPQGWMRNSALHAEHLIL